MYSKALPLCYKMQKCVRAKSNSNQQPNKCSVAIYQLLVHGVTCTLSSSYKHFLPEAVLSKVEHSLPVSHSLIVKNYLIVNVSTR